MNNSFARRAKLLAKFSSVNPKTLLYIRSIKKSGHFDRNFYLGVNEQLHWLLRAFPERHYAVFGEAQGFQPNPDFSPNAYIRHNPDIAGTITSAPLGHYIKYGQFEQRLTKDLPVDSGQTTTGVQVFRPKPAQAPYAVVLHVYYHDLWPEIAERLKEIDIPFDLFVTVTYKGSESDELAEEITTAFPDSSVLMMPNRGRDIFPFVYLVNTGALDGYKAVCKIHTKKSPHRQDGDHWRQHLISGLLDGAETSANVQKFLSSNEAAIWVADGQHFDDTRWWGSNRGKTESLLRRAGILVDDEKLAFPAGSMYWLKPVMIAMIRGLNLDIEDFDIEYGQVDGTTAHAFERALGFMVDSAGAKTFQTTEVKALRDKVAPAHKPKFVSAFYLPQFHTTPENDAWWGKGYTEWTAITRAQAQYDGHAHPSFPGDLGFYDLRVPETLGQQAELAKDAGIDAFCVYHYWFDRRRILEAPIDNLLKRPDIDFPFYLCWANESWRRNWDGLSGEILLEQSYRDGFAKALAEDTIAYFRDPRYQRPDGKRPRFVIYRPEDMPDPSASIRELRKVWAELGEPEVELGAVRFHIEGDHPVNEDDFDFWIEMPPHGLVGGEDFLYGGMDGNKLGFEPRPDFAGLIYDYQAVIRNSKDPEYIAQLPHNTITGVMPSWDNTPRRGTSAHIAFGGNPGAFQRWLRSVETHRLKGSYRNELFINAWNEWAECAVMEPSSVYGRSLLNILKDWRS